MEETSRDLKARLTPHEITASMPKIYTEETLQAALRERLTDDELKMIVNPLASTPEMDRWARELTAGTTGDLEKAKKLFNALIRHLHTGEGGTRTAMEVFAAWKDPAQSFSCQEYAKLYVALARAVGVKCFYVHLEKDYLGDCVYHDCAAVFSDGKAYLVDAAYIWFGVPHKDYLVLDDLQTIAHQFFQPSEKGQNVARCQLATKLHPDLAWGQMQLTAAFLQENQPESARKALAAALHLESNRWDGLYYQGKIAMQTGKQEAAVEYFRKSLEINPKFGDTHLCLGATLHTQGKLKESRDELRLAILYSQSAKQTTVAYRLIAEINEQLEGK
jgi:tetratricopeptide (TPR) repeat protein